MNSLTAAFEMFRHGNFAEAERACQALTAGAAPDPGALALLADIQLATNKIDAAIASLSELVVRQPQDAAHRRRLGGALLRAGRAADAAHAFESSLELEPSNVRGLNNLGQTLLRLGRADEAIVRFRRAIDVDPNYAIGYVNLGLALTAAGLPKPALEALHRAVEIAPTSVDAWSALGAVQLQLQRFEDALASTSTALNLQPNDAATAARKSAALLALDRAGEALTAAEEALRLNSGVVDGHFAKAAVLTRLNKPTEALSCLERALSIEPGLIDGWCNRAIVHQNLGDHDSAARCYRRALAIDSGSIAARTGLISALIPSIPDSPAQADQARLNFDAALGSFEKWIQRRTLTESDAWGIARQQFFYLSYRPACNKALLQRYRSASAARLAEFQPPQRIGAAARRSDSRLKLGIVSAHVHDHSVYNAIVQGWLRNLDRERFDTTVFCVGSGSDASTRTARAAVDRFETGAGSLADWAALIRKSALDVLIFPEIGIDRNTLALANLRLAPRQFAAWGHPETSGLPTIDGYISAASFEPDNADEHYTERLIRLPGMGVYYEPFETLPQPVDLAKHGIPADTPLLVCPGTPFKYQPEDDQVLISIAQRLGSCRFVFFEHEKTALSRQLGTRLASAFNAAGLDSRRYLVWLPWLPRASFLGLLQQAHVMLDTIGFSGFNTVMQAVQANAAIVALEGRFMRGRFGSGILRRLGLPELVAADHAGYVDIAVRLAGDAAGRSAIRERLRRSEPGVYRDRSTVGALAALLQES